MRKKGAVLDLGCGRYCRGDIGIDIQFEESNPYDDPERFDGLVGEQNPLCDRIQADLNYGIPIRSGSVKIVIMRDVLEHLLRPYDTLLEIRRVLSEGGYLLLTVPNAQKSMADERDETHLYSFTPWTIERLVGKVLEVESVELHFNEESILVRARKVSHRD